MFSEVTGWVLGRDDELRTLEAMMSAVIVGRGQVACEEAAVILAHARELPAARTGTGA